MSRLLVVGATGLLGRAVCQRANAAGYQVRALVRPASPRRASLERLGYECVDGDLKDPPSLSRACQGCDAVVTTANTMTVRGSGDSLDAVDRRGSLALLAAAAQGGVQQFVYTSVTPALPSNNQFVAIKREVEAAVRASGLRWTILQPAAFMEVHAGPVAGWDFGRHRARLVGRGDTPVDFISIHDVAAFATAALTHPAAVNRTLVLNGPEALTGNQTVEIAGRVLGRPFSVQRAPLAAIRVIRAIVGPFNEHVSALLGLMLGQEEPATAASAFPPMYVEFGVTPTMFADYVRSQAGSGR